MEDQYEFAAAATSAAKTAATTTPADVAQLPVLLLVVLALGNGVAAQSLIQKQLDGDQGLGAFLKDGSGYSKSAFRPITNGDRAVSQGDPLPWLKLPILDFVDVAGQGQSNNNKSSQTGKNDDADLETITQMLASLRAEINQHVAKGNTAEANAVTKRIEMIMAEKGIFYNVDE